ncbi:MAG: hybrid sensor histidine kinase/response regulator [Rhizobium sp.]|nr:hybrid sensor histidine kinase/response regulator [Rhizobium sp.]
MLEVPKSAIIADERYRLLIDSITDYAIYMLDAGGHVVSWNPGAERFKGYSEQEIRGRHFSTFYTPEDRQQGRPEIALRTAAEQGRFEGEGWRLRKDGSRFWAHVIIDTIRDKKGGLIGFAKITRDLSERKSSEELLRKSEQQFRLLVQGVTDYAIYMMDPEGHVSSWNAGAERIKGYKPEEIISEHFSRFFRQEDREAGIPEKALHSAKEHGRYESEGWRIRKDGTRFWANAIIDAIHDDTGKLIGFAKVTRDITEKRAADKQLMDAREELFQAQKMEAVGQLTGGMAHDFNNLLMAIQGSLELLRKKLPPSRETAPLIANALQATQRGASLTQRMLAFSRKQELKYESVDIVELVRGMTDLLQRSLGPAIIVETQFPPRLPPVLTDANQLASALLNLALNARDAMPKGGFLTIGASVHSGDRIGHADLKGDQYVCLSIKDEGEGMDEKILASALTPFFTTKGIGKGTGLGLPMVQGLMAQSHGKLVLHSKKDIGTTAELWLPVTDAAIPESQEESEMAETADDTKLSVLTVDDDPLVLMNTVLMLEDLGHTVKEANSASEALQFLSENTFDLVITDYAMPRMTGGELAAIVNEKWPATRIVLATGYADLPSGANTTIEFERLPKPFTQQQLEAVTRRASVGGPLRR